MDLIRIHDLEIFCQVGVTQEERDSPQRLLVCLEMEHDFTAAISGDNLAETVDYQSVCQRLLGFGEGCHWQLIETLAADIASTILSEYKPRTVAVEVKKFVIAQAAYVSVLVRRAVK